MSSGISTDGQRAFYETRDHDHLQVRDDDLYAQKLTRELCREAGIEGHHRVLEIGAGFGRFTFPLLEHCGTVVALDLAPRLLDELARERDARGISADRCVPLCADVQAVDAVDGDFDFVVGFFILHHLPDIGQAIRSLRGCLSRTGQMIFLEPNRRNPLFLAQVMCCPDMTWEDEKGMFRLSAKGVEASFRSASLAPRPVRTFGFFPPQIFNRFEVARAAEDRIEKVPPLRPFLPFLLLSAAVPG